MDKANRKASGAPSDLEHYLDHYRTLNKPGFAVLVTAPWGSGKTHQVKQLIPEEERYYVSLFGIDSVDALHAAVLAAAVPTNELINTAAEDLGKKVGFGGLVPSVATALMQRNLKPDRVLIFDDLERCKIKPADVLGAINTYLEHKGFQVILIADDEKLPESFKELKEKLVGQTLRIDPNVDAAWPAFGTSSQDDGCKGLVETYGQLILQVFSRSKCQSLRVLRHVKDDVARLSETLTDTHRAHDAAMRRLVALFVALNIEVRMGMLGEMHLSRRKALSYAAYTIVSGHGWDKKQFDFDESVARDYGAADEKYAEIDLSDHFVPDEVLVDMLVHGRYEAEKVQACLNASPYFTKAEDLPPWRVVMDWQRQDDDVVEAARVRMAEQFDAREVTESGEMLHMFALRLMLVEDGIMPGTQDQEVENCKAYIDDLEAEGRLPAAGINGLWTDDFVRSHGGLVYWKSESKLVDDLRDTLIEARERVLEQRYPTIAADLMALMATDAHKFFDAVCHGGDGPSVYANHPVFAGVETEAFVHAWLTAPKKNWVRISDALSDRYSGGMLNDKLKPERGWALRMREALLERADASSGWEKARIRRVVPRFLTKIAEPDDGAAADGLTSA